MKFTKLREHAKRIGGGALSGLAAAAAITCTSQPPSDTGRAAASALSDEVPGCTGRRWVGRATTDCRVVGLSEWKAAPVFENTNVPGLAPYCLYEFSGPPGPPNPASLAAFQAALTADGVEGLEEDCVVVEPLGVPGDPREWAKDEFLRGVGALQPLPAGTPTTVRIAVPDSSPASPLSGGIPMGQLPHGYTMGWIARDLSCPTGSATCTSDVATEIALPRVDNGTVDYVDGGYFGTRTELAAAIFSAVTKWKVNAATEPRLVINLSVGWERDFGCGDPSIPATMTTTQSIVLAALSHASCHGAITVAAAGNNAGGALPIYGKNEMPDMSGPTCPAAWSTRPAMTALDCATFEPPKYDAALPPYARFYVPPVPAPTPLVDAPLLYAAGGIDYANRPISVTRPAGSPRLAALAFHGVDADPADPLPLPLTGTSVAAATVSGIAATVWAYRPELTAPEVMDLVYRSGALLTRTADFASPGVATDVRRVSLCDALTRACTGAGSHPLCPSAIGPCVAPPAVGDNQNPALPPDVVTYLSTLFAGATTYVFNPVTGAPPPPETTYRNLGAAPWVEPQPLRPPCPACSFNPSSNALWIIIDPTYPANLTLSQMTLTITGPDATNPNYFKTLTYQPASPATMDCHTDPFEITNIDTSPLLYVNTASLSWVSTDAVTGQAGSVSQQIILNY